MLRKLIQLTVIFITAYDFKCVNCLEQASCNFENDLCGYLSKNFVRFSGRSPSSSSGPNNDVTTGKEGYYTLCDARLLLLPVDKCVLSKEIEINRTLSLSFWYHMYGAQIGTLELIRDDSVLWS